MKKFLCLCVTLFLLSGSRLLAQEISLKLDSVTSLLCKKWEIDYAMMGGMKIGRMPNATEVNLEFFNDKTVLITGNSPKDKFKGKWNYITAKKIIEMTVNGKRYLSIISLKKDELILIPNAKKNTGAPTDIKIVYKAKQQ
jgi:hypothetical protein